MTRFFRASVLALTCAAMPAFAHHGISNWDLNKDVTLNGTLKRIELINSAGMQAFACTSR